MDLKSKIRMRYGLWFGLILFFITSLCQSQDIQEREHRIRKSQFPTMQLNSTILGPKIKQKRYYKEVDSLGITYFLKFKKDRLHYFLSFDQDGNLVNSGFRVTEVDIPEETYQEIKEYLSHSFEKFRVKRIFQEYPPTNTENDIPTLTDTFQNLILPSNVYKLIVNIEINKRRSELDLWFRADGSLLRKRPALPMNHDRILY